MRAQWARKQDSVRNLVREPTVRTRKTEFSQKFRLNLPLPPPLTVNSKVILLQQAITLLLHFPRIIWLTL